MGRRADWKRHKVQQSRMTEENLSLSLCLLNYEAEGGSEGGGENSDQKLLMTGGGRKTKLGKIERL